MYNSELNTVYFLLVNACIYLHEPPINSSKVMTIQEYMKIKTYYNINKCSNKFTTICVFSIFRQLERYQSMYNDEKKT